MGYVISPLLFVLVMEMIWRNNNNKKTVQSMKTLMDDGTTRNPPTGTLQMGSDEDKNLLNAAVYFYSKETAKK